MSEHTATVEVLTAEVRVLMVGSRQVTLSVYNQLDLIDDWQIEPFGRVSSRSDVEGYIYVVGCDKVSGALARSRRPSGDLAIYHRLHSEANTALRADICKIMRQLNTRPGFYYERSMHLEFLDEHPDEHEWAHDRQEELSAEAHEWQDLPLIVLAGLR